MQPVLWQQESCPQCGGRIVRGYDHAPERHWRRLNVCQLPSEIGCALPRGECQGCRKIYTVRAPWEGRSRGLTQEFEAFASMLMREMPVKKAGEAGPGRATVPALLIFPARPEGRRCATTPVIYFPRLRC